MYTKIVQPICFILILLIFRCTDPVISNPDVEITDPQSMLSVSEIIEIEFTVRSTEHVEMHELIVDGKAVGEGIVEEPFLLRWNTTTYENKTIHIIHIRSEMSDGSVFNSNPINLRIDHEGSYPVAVELKPIQPDENSYILGWTKSNEPDFNRYELYESSNEDMENATLLSQSFDAQDTSYLVSNTQMDGTRFYCISVVDQAGLNSKSNIMDNYLRFGTVIEGGAANWGGDMAKLGENFYLLTNAHYNQHAEYEMYIIDKYGQLLSQIIYPQTGVGYPSTLIPTEEGNLLLAGTTQSDFRVLLVNSIGQLYWENTYSSWCSETPYALAQTSDGRFLITGTTRTCDVITYRRLTIKIDASGNRLETIIGEPSEYEVARGILATDDGGWIIMAEESNRPDEVWIAKMDSSGEIEWSEEYDYHNYGYAHSLIATDDGGYMIAGSQDGYNQETYGAHLLKLNSEGGVDWVSTVGECVNCEALDIKQTEDGGYVLCGYKDNNDAWLLRTDSQGELLWERVYRGNQKEAFVSVEVAEDSGYYLHGYSAPFFTGRQFTWFVKTDPLGKTVLNHFPTD